MKRLLLLLLATLTFTITISAENNPFATKPRYGNDPFYGESSYKKKSSSKLKKVLLKLIRRVYPEKYLNINM